MTSFVILYSSVLYSTSFSYIAAIMEKQSLTVEAAIAAPINTVWSCWTEPQHITQWNAASPDWHCPRASNDLQVGGKYFARMEAKDCSFGFDFEAIYDEVVPQKTITYTMTDGRRATTEFEDLGGTTRVTTRFDADSEHSLDLQQAGWQAILNNFKQYVEGKQ
jgi:uncharacterized protein YndB with AHSA1/START domain